MIEHIETLEWVTKPQAAEIVSAKFFKIAPMTIGRWPVTKKYIGGKALLNTAQVLERAELIMAAAPTDYAVDETVRGKGLAAIKNKKSKTVA